MHTHYSSSHLPCKAITFAIVVPKVAHFAVLDVHSCFSHIVLRLASAGLAAVGDYLRDDADVRPPTVLVFARAVFGGIPGEYL